MPSCTTWSQTKGTCIMSSYVKGDKNDCILQEMIAYPYKLDAQIFIYTTSTVELDMESALEHWERVKPKLVFQISSSEMSHCIIH